MIYIIYSYIRVIIYNLCLWIAIYILWMYVHCRYYTDIYYILYIYFGANPTIYKLNENIWIIKLKKQFQLVFIYLYSPHRFPSFSSSFCNYYSLTIPVNKINNNSYYALQLNILAQTYYKVKWNEFSLNLKKSCFSLYSQLEKYFV